MNETVKAILERSSVRKYTAQPLSEEQKQTLIDCALAAPSGGNLQPWHFSVVEDQERLLELEADLVERFMSGDNEVMKQRLIERNKKVLFDAPVVIFVSMPERCAGHELDCGIAVQNIVIAAQSMGLSTIILGGLKIAFTQGDKTEYYARRMGIPEEHRLMAAVAVGYGAERPAPHAPDRGKVTYVE